MEGSQYSGKHSILESRKMTINLNLEREVKMLKESKEELEA